MGTAARFDDFNTIQSAEIGLIAPMARWCECLHGCAPFREALEAIAKAIGAEAAAVCRVSAADGARSGSLFFDGQPAGTGAKRLAQSFAHAVLGTYLGKAKPGMIWYKSMSGRLEEPALEQFHQSRGLTDLAVIPLVSGSGTTDVLEFHFARQPGPMQQALLNMVAGTFVRTWSNRAPGLYMEACLNNRRARAAAPDAPLLSMENPAQLSRAEYRVCVLLSKGQTAKRVESQLGISKSTLRTHLRNIYAKTGAGNMTELVYRLVSMEGTPPAPMKHGSAA